MKILIIGHSVEDHIHYNEKELLQPGGIYYSVKAFNEIRENADEFFLCTAVEKANLPLFSEEYEKMNLKYLQSANEIPKVHLIIEKNNERGECYQNISDNLNLNFEGINSFDGILINMITGYDISLNQLKKLRAEFKGKIYLDIHTLSRGLEKLPAGQGLRREFRRIPGCDQWLSAVDIIQVNQSEVKTISEFDDEINAAGNALTKEGQIIIVTKDKMGAEYYTLRDSKIISGFSPAIEVDAKNKVGCGDVFGTVFFYTYIKTGNLDDSMTKANAAAGLAASRF